jgi:hypothetical protein
MPYVHVDVNLDDFNDDELIEELQSRGFSNLLNASNDTKSALMEIYLQRRLGLPYDSLLDKLIYDVLGKVI